MKVLKTEKYAVPPSIIALRKTQREESRKCGNDVIANIYEKNGEICVDYVDITTTKRGVDIVSIATIEIDEYQKIFSGSI